MKKEYTKPTVTHLRKEEAAAELAKHGKSIKDMKAVDVSSTEE